jgi:putative nucleotidyltransferase with HDIG domain
MRRLAEENSWSMDPVNALENVGRETNVTSFAQSPQPVFPQSTLRSAVMRLGYLTTRKVVLATVFRPVFTRPSMRPLLQHSLEAAELAHHLAARVPAIDREEAFLCGLLHDVGKLLMDRLNLFDSARMQGLLDHGCPPVYAENLLMGCDHGKAGAGVAAHWKLPTRHVEAIRYHHQPEGASSPMAHLLYLVEWRLGHLEDMPSAPRIGLCMESMGITEHSLDGWHNDQSPLALVA